MSTEGREGRAGREPAGEHVDVLRRRAALLARTVAAESERAAVRAITFRIGQERFALDARRVHEVMVLRELTPLPGAREPLFGVTHWRGDVLTLLDLRAPLRIRTRGITDLAKVVVCEGSMRAFGIVVDAVGDMVDIVPGDVRGRPGADGEADALIAGMLDDATLVIDGDALVRVSEVQSTATDFGGRTT